MIAPDVAIVDLDPEGFAWLCRLLARRQLAAERVVTLVHDSGRVLGVRDSAHGWLDGHDAPVTDAVARAAELRAATGADRALVVDRAGLGEVLATAAAAATPEATQISAFRAAAHAWWASPAVAASPAPPADRWEQVEAWLEAQTSPLAALFAVRDGDAWLLTLVATAREGRVDLLTSAPGVAGRELAGAGPEELVAAVESALRRPLDLVLACARADAEPMLAAPDLPRAARELATSGAALLVRDRAGFLDARAGTLARRRDG